MYKAQAVGLGYVLDVFDLKSICVNDHLCLLLEITLFVMQTYSNTMEVYKLYKVKNTKLIKCFRKHTFKFKHLMPQANLLELEMNIYFCNCPINH